MTDEPTPTIGQVAARAGLNTSRIRFYERTGVLPLPDRVSGQRRYHPEVLHRLSIIDVAQRAGMSLDEIAPLTGPENRTADASAHIRALADDKLPHIEALITRAQAVKAWLEVAQHCDCRASTSAACSSTPRCCRRSRRSTSTCATSDAPLDLNPVQPAGFRTCASLPSPTSPNP